MESPNNHDFKNENGANEDMNNNANRSVEANRGEIEAITYPGLRAMPYIISNEAFEKLASVGSFVNFSIYLTTKFHMKIVTANQTLSFFHGTCALATIIGAFLSDTYFGRYKCLAVGSIATLMGMVVIVLTAAVPILRENVGFLIVGLAFLVVGAGGVRPCSLPFRADQFQPDSRGLTSFFMWYFVTTSIAFIISLTFTAYLQSISWTIGLAVPASLMLLAVCLFFIGTNLYIRVRPQGSPLTSFAQVLVSAFRKRKLKVPQDISSSLFDPEPASSTVTKLPHTNWLRCLDKAALITSGFEINTHGLAANPWRLCSVEQVEEVKCWIGLLPFWVSSVIFNIAPNVHGAYMMFQAQLLDRHPGASSLQIPVGSYNVFSALSGTMLVFVYDRIILTIIRRTAGANGITLLQRLGAGIIFAALTMLISGVVEKIRKDTALSSPTNSSISMSALVLLPQLMLLGFAEACAMTAQMNFYYQQMPGNSKTFAQAFLASAGAVSNYITLLLFSIFRDGWLVQDLDQGKLDLFYYMIGGLQVANFIYLVFCTRWYRRMIAEA